MQITKISYSKTVESMVLGAGVWVKIGVEGELRDGENVGNSIEEAMAYVEDAHSKHKEAEPTQNRPTENVIYNVSKNRYEPL